MSNSRRSFLRGAALTGVALSMPFKNELMAMAANPKPFALQLWSVKMALYKDTMGVLKQVAANGYKKIEGFEGDLGLFWGMKNTEFKKVMDDLGMNMFSSHCEHTDDFKLKATNDKTAPVTLVRLILAGGPLTEKQIGFVIFKLAIFSGTLAIITAFMMGVSL